MSKKLLGVGVALALVAAVLVGGASVASANANCDMITVLANAGLIAADKVAVAQAAAGCGASASASYMFTRELTVGSTGADVTALQTKLGVSPATGYFGPITKAAVMAYQTANGLPSTGYVGPLTLAKLNYVAPVVVTPGTPSTPVVTGGDEGDIKSLTVLASPSNEDIAEGETVKVFGFEVEASDDSDLKLSRLDVIFDQGSTAGRQWEAFDTVNLLRGSTEVASVDNLDSKSTWTEVSKTDKTYRVRFSGLDDVIKAGTKVKYYVQVVAQSSIDEGDFTGSANFTVYIPANGLRVVDGAGIDIYEPSANSSSKAVDVGDLQAADVTVTDSDSNPDARTVIVDVDNDTTGVELLSGEIESADDAIVVNTVRVYATSSIAVYSMVGDMILELDGNEYSGTIGSTTALSTYYDFDVDGDVTIAKDDTVALKVMADINKNATGTLAVAFPGNSTTLDAESENTGDAVTSIAGTATGETVTLALVGVDVSLTKKTLTVTSADSSTDDYATGTFEVKITNNSKEILYVPLTATATTTASTTAGVSFLATIGGSVVSTSTASVVIDQLTALTETSDSVKIQKGQSATLEVIVTFKPGYALTTYKLELDTVHFSETAGAYDQTYTAPETASYRTSTVTIVN